jgi:hypothetical protein
MWTLVVCVAASCIVIDGFSRLDDCRLAGQLNVEQVNPRAQFRCEKTGRPPAHCKPDLRTYGRTGECIT